MNRNCNNCSSEEIYLTDGFDVCHDCGSFNASHPILIPNFQTRENTRLIYIPKIIYKRINYFSDLLGCMTNRRKCYDEKYINIVKKLGKYKKTLKLRDIKKLLKKNKCERYNKYIYGIYYDLYKINLIEISNNDYYGLLVDFKNFNIKYIHQIKKRNQFNYPFIMSKLFEKRNISVQHLMLPKTIDKLEEKYNLLS